MKRIQMPARLKPLYAAAKKARANAHAPHSGCLVGAAIRLKDGKTYSGCNVENSSYGAGVCAERGAIQTAIAAEGKIRIQELVVVTDATPPWAPCGICRQVLSEFVDHSPKGDIPIYLTNLEGDVLETTFKALYPGGFSSKELQAGKKKPTSKKKRSPRKTPSTRKK